MNKKLLVAALFAATTTSVFAQSKFEGFYGQLGVGYSSVNPSISSSTLTPPAGNSPSSYNLTPSVSTSSSFNGAISTGFNFSVQPQFLLGIGVDYMPVAGQSANTSLSNSSLSPSTLSLSYKQNSLYNVYLTPGFAIEPDKLLYAKLGYSGLQIKTTSSTGATGTTNFNGYLVGLGYKQIIKGGLYGFGEVGYSSYGNQTLTATGSWTTAPTGTYNISTTVNANAFNAMVGVGYKF
jgi:outer membrane immunogenic protein